MRLGRWTGRCIQQTVAARKCTRSLISYWAQPVGTPTEAGAEADANRPRKSHKQAGHWASSEAHNRCDRQQPAQPLPGAVCCRAAVCSPLLDHGATAHGCNATGSMPTDGFTRTHMDGSIPPVFHHTPQHLVALRLPRVPTRPPTTLHHHPQLRCPPPQHTLRQHPPVALQSVGGQVPTPPCWWHQGQGHGQQHHPTPSLRRRPPHLPASPATTLKTPTSRPPCHSNPHPPSYTAAGGGWLAGWLVG